MPGPISLEVRKRAVAGYRRGNSTIEKVASMFGVGPASLNRWLRLERETGTLRHRKMGGFVPPLITDADLETLTDIVALNNDAFVYELVELYEAEKGVNVSTSVMSRALARAGLTRKKRPSTPLNAKASVSKD